MIDQAQANQQTFADAETICQEMRTQVPARRERGPKSGTGGIQRPTTVTFPRELNAAIENWRMLQPGRPTARSRDRGVGRRLVVRHDGYP
jgi:hypothetical protein